MDTEAETRVGEVGEGSGWMLEDCLLLDGKIELFNKIDNALFSGSGELGLVPSRLVEDWWSVVC